jgi:hypothetical protein
MSLILSGSDGLSDVDGSAATPAIRGTDANTGIFFPAADTVAVTTGGTERARVDSSGNLGLGVTPSAWYSASGFKALQVGLYGFTSVADGGSAYTSRLMNNSYYNSGGSPAFTGANYASEYRQTAGVHSWHTSTASGTAGNAITFTQAMTLDASGNLGVGTTSVTGAFEIYRDTASGTSTAYPNIKLNNNNASGYTGLYFYNGATSKAGFELKNDVGALTIQTANAERARIDSSGNLLVGTTSGATNARLSVVQPTSNVITVNIQNTASTTPYCLDIQTSGATAGSGTFVRGFITGSTQTLNILNNGNITNTNNSYGAISDARLKENVTDATPKLAQLNQIRVVNYNLIGDTNKQIGVVAQELEQVFPSMVETSPDIDKEGNDLGTTTKSVKYSVFVPMLIKAIQEQQALITSLTARITALETP